jgi:hypothetical protein
MLNEVLLCFGLFVRTLCLIVLPSRFGTAAVRNVSVDQGLLFSLILHRSCITLRDVIDEAPFWRDEELPLT